MLGVDEAPKPRQSSILNVRNSIMRTPLSLLAVAILGLAPDASAHERWVKHALKSEFDHSLFTSAGLINVGTLIGILVLALLLFRWSGRVRARYPDRASDLRTKLLSWAPFLLRVTFGLGLVLVAWQDQFLAPDLWADHSLQGSLLVKSQGVLGVLLVLGLLTRFASLAFLALFAWATLLRPFAPFDGEPVTIIGVLNYLEVVGIAIYLAVVGGGALSLDRLFLREDVREATPRSRAKAVGVMRILLGATLIILGMQKFLIPELPMGVVQNYADAIYTPIARLTGISPEGYVFAAVVVETTVGLLVLAGLFIRPLMVVLAGLFVTTLFVFGEDLIPHLPLFGMVFAFLIEGAGAYRLDEFTMPKKPGIEIQAGHAVVENIA